MISCLNLDVFDKGSSPDTAAHRMFTLKQGRRSVANFSMDLWTLAKETGWEEKALRGAFLNNQNEGIRRELATKELPKTLDILINMYIRLDDHTSADRRRFKSLVEDSAHSMAGNEARVDKEEQPMQLGLTKLSHLGRRRRLLVGLFHLWKEGAFC